MDFRRIAMLAAEEAVANAADTIGRAPARTIDSPAHRLRMQAVDVLDRVIRHPRTSTWEEVESAVERAGQLLREARAAEVQS